MIKLKRIALNSMPPLVLALCLMPASAVFAAAPAADAQAQARQILMAPRATATSGGARAYLREPGSGSDAAHAAQRLLLGGVPREQAGTSASALAALAGSHAARASRQDAQAQARGLIHG
jgi:hypothetical protein